MEVNGEWKNGNIYSATTVKGNMKEKKLISIRILNIARAISTDLKVYFTFWFVLMHSK